MSGPFSMTEVVASARSDGSPDGDALEAKIRSLDPAWLDVAAMERCGELVTGAPIVSVILRALELQAAS